MLARSLVGPLGVQYSLKELPSLQTAYDWCSVNVVEDSFVARTFSTEETIDDMTSGEDAGPFQVTAWNALEPAFCRYKGTNDPPLSCMMCAFSGLGARDRCCLLVAGDIAGLDSAVRRGGSFVGFPTEETLLQRCKVFCRGEGGY